MKRGWSVVSKGIITGLLILAVFILFLTKESLSSEDGPGVKNTPHDLSDTGGCLSADCYPWSYQTTEVCVFCHTPHAGQGSTPLWNKPLPSSSFSMYTSPTFEMGPAGQMGSVVGTPSILCMSCHDGTMAMNVVTNSPGRGTTGSIPDGGMNTRMDQVYNPSWPGTYPGPNISGSYSGGGESIDKLTDEHPISFTYNPGADTEGNNFPAVASGVITGASGTKYRLYGSNKDQFECSTCHDVHDTATYDKLSQGGRYEIFFLRGSNLSSQMCRDCHTGKY